MRLTVSITNTGSYSSLASVSAATPDPALANNTSAATLTGLNFQPTDSVKNYPATIRALAYDPLRRRLFAALPTNQVAWFDPESGFQQGVLSTAFAPMAMLVTEDGQYLYLAASNTRPVQRVSLASLTSDLVFVPNEATSVGATAVVPGSPRSLVVNYCKTNGCYTAGFDDALAQSNMIAGSLYPLLAVSSDGTNFFGYDPSGTGSYSPDVFRMNLTPQGLQPLDHGPTDTPWGRNYGMVYASNRFFFANGNVLNPAGWVEEQGFPLPAWGISLTTIPPTGNLAFLVGDPFSGPIAHVPIYAISRLLKKSH